VELKGAPHPNNISFIFQLKIMQKQLIAIAIAASTLAGGWFALSGKHTNSINFNGTGTIRGLVTDAETGNAISNAQIAVNNTYWYTTDSTGNFEITALPAGEYTLLAKATGYEDATEKCKVKDGEIVTVAVQMQLSTTVSTDSVSEITVVSKKKMQVLQLSKSEAAYDMTNGATYYPSVMLNEGLEHYDPEHNTESYKYIQENGFRKSLQEPLSTFSIDVDNASYSNVRRFIQYGQTVPRDAVRIEELVNYFDYTYEKPKTDEPFAVNYELSECPWNPEMQLLMIGIQGKDIDLSTADPCNLVFLIDVSGSMQSANKLPLVKSSLKYLVDQLRPNDRVALVVYAGAAGEVLPSTNASNTSSIHNAIDKLEAGGSTAGGAGLRLAYDIATKHFIDNGNNRVILCTDGDFNVGESSDAAMTQLIEEKRKTGVFITVCGFGMGNYQDSKLESIADNGNGAYYYIDTEKEAKKVFGADLRGTLFTIAKDVKIQLEFNPALVESYRLVGYENRLLNNEDFENDLKDAGDLGAGHRVTAMYEIKRTAVVSQPGSMQHEGLTEDLKYQSSTVKQFAYNTNELMTLKLRYKTPAGEVSKLIEKPLYNNPVKLEHSSDNYRFASAVVEFGMLLRDSEHKGNATLNEVLTLAEAAKGSDSAGLRADFIEMVKQYQGLASK